MAIPSGSGTEVLKNAAIKGNGTWSKIRWDTPIAASGNSSGTVAVPANCIITVISVIATNTTGSSGSFAMRIDIGSTDEIYLLQHNGTNIPAYNTFSFTDRYILTPDNELEFYSSQPTDIVISYIYQDWS